MFAVYRQNWRPAGPESGRWFLRAPGEARVADFPTAEEAAADAAAREEAARRLVNPFRCGLAWAGRSTMPEPVFRDFLLDDGIDPPAAGADWAEWWDAVAPGLPAGRRFRVWDGLNRLRFYRTAERKPGPVGYAVVEVVWHYNDQWHYPGDEGGRTVTVYRSRERAEAEAARRTADDRAHWRRQMQDLVDQFGPAAGGRDYDFHMYTRQFPGDDPFAPPRRPPPRPDAHGHDRGLFGIDEVPAYEVVEVDLEGLS